MSARIGSVEAFSVFIPNRMQNSKWVKLIPKEEVLRLKGDESFEFTIPNLCMYQIGEWERSSDIMK